MQAYRRKAPLVEAIRIAPENLDVIADLRARYPNLAVSGERALMELGGRVMQVEVNHHDGVTQTGHDGDWLILHGGEVGHLSILSHGKFKNRYEKVEAGCAS